MYELAKHVLMPAGCPQPQPHPSAGIRGHRAPLRCRGGDRASVTVQRAPGRLRLYIQYSVPRYVDLSLLKSVRIPGSSHGRSASPRSPRRAGRRAATRGGPRLDQRREVNCLTCADGGWADWPGGGTGRGRLRVGWSGWSQAAADVRMTTDLRGLRCIKCEHAGGYQC